MCPQARRTRTIIIAPLGAAFLTRFQRDRNSPTRRSHHPSRRSQTPGRVVTAMARVHYQHPPSLRPFRRSSRWRSPRRHLSLPRSQRLAPSASIPGSCSDGPSSRNRAPPSLRGAPHSTRRSHLLLRRRTSPHRRFRRRAIRRNRTCRRPGSPSPHANHSRRARRGARTKSCRRAQPQTSIFSKRSRQPAQIQIHSRTASVRGPPLVVNRSPLDAERDRPRTQPRPQSISRRTHAEHFDRPARAKCFFQ